jgi:chromosomal replication initiator protein
MPRRAGRGRPPRRCRDVQPALHPRRRRLGKTHLLQAVTWAGNSGQRAQGALSHRREIHVRLRRGAEDADGARLQGGAARHRRAGDRRPAVPAGQIDPGRVLPHAERADRCRPPGGDRGRPSAVRSRKPRRPRALAARRRPRGRDGLARRRTAARNPEIARRGGAAISCELRRAGAGAGLSRRTITHNGRDLEGAINRLLAHSKLNASR